MDASVDKIRKGRKYDQVIEGARDVFLRDGYDGASVDDIARAAGVSKATLYSYFSDKRLLFMEVARLQCRHQAEEAITHLDRDKPTAELFYDAGRTFLDIIFSPLAIQNCRMCLAEAERFPALAEEFWRFGPVYFVDAMLSLFDLAIARGDLDIPQDRREHAAHQFGELCKAGLYMARLFNIRGTVSDVEKDENVRDAVKVFLARYGTA
ncbi:TetR/AcrR family transcriptional regulator [Roseivivax sp. THAF30]|uniref:TetR/AcrR family transcriptional regulator n=1 Tax=Roseivivax sp. THAF30 TaxID=2587852 RepID=UPI0012678A84|nr:TetR/AcrR family transcriptional regulator [Roseivivax sp. THAF30]QFT61545.1 Biofilm operon icaADBC HTH-type negative transcriptional regulator IcaR [Roseivivax sp. THAF30]